MHVRVINPVITTRWEEDTRRTYTTAARPDTHVSVVSLDWGPSSIECHRDVALAVPDIVTKAVQAEQEEIDAVIIDCMSDPGLYQAREMVSIPVVGPAQSSMLLAAMLGHRFSVLTVFDHGIPTVEEQVACYGLSAKLASVRAFNIPVLALDDDIEAALQVLIDLSEQAVQQDGAHVIIPGCTGLAGLAPRIQAGLAGRGCEVPVLDPPSAAMKLAESLVDMGQAHSKRTYPQPPVKQIHWPVKGTFDV
jgi:allantoin racemase